MGRLEAHSPPKQSAEQLSIRQLIKSLVCVPITAPQSLLEPLLSEVEQLFAHVPTSCSSGAVPLSTTPSWMQVSMQYASPPGLGLSLIVSGPPQPHWLPGPVA